jgi:hypothetical protein
MPTTKEKTYPISDASIRQVILNRLEELGAGPYDLAHYAEVDVSPSTVFRFLSGTGDMLASNVEQILRCLGLVSFVAEDVSTDWIRQAGEE